MSNFKNLKGFEATQDLKDLKGYQDTRMTLQDLNVKSQNMQLKDL